MAPQLMSLRIQGITPEYIRAIQQLGYTLNGSELINARVQGITPTIYAMRQIFPSASIRHGQHEGAGDLSDFIQEMRQIYPSASIRDVTAHEGTSDFSRLRARCNGNCIHQPRSMTS
jgi:hypothetical protein